MQTFRIIAKNPSHENAASKLVLAAVRFFILAVLIRFKQHSAPPYEMTFLPFFSLPLSANPFLRIGAFLKLWLWDGAPFSKAIRLFSRPKHSAEERQIVRLANQALLSSAELIKCAERGVRTLHSDAQLMDCLYDDELTTSENLPILMAASRQARPVSAAIANLYLHKQIVFERC